MRKLADRNDRPWLRAVGTDLLFVDGHAQPAAVFITGVVLDPGELKSQLLMKPLTGRVGRCDEGISRTHPLKGDQVHQGPVKVPAKAAVRVSSRR